MEKCTKIFIVEDNEAYSRLLKNYLNTNLPFKVDIYSFTNGEDCMSNMGIKPHIIILDYYLNSKDDTGHGIGLLKRIKVFDPEACVIILSGQDNIKVATDSIKYGAFEYLAKNENAFLRVQNSIQNACKLREQADQVKRIKRILIIIAWAILLVGFAITYFVNFK